MYTTAKRYPWYAARAPTAITLPVNNGNDASNQASFYYRYAVYRAGVFHRWEDPTDGPSGDDSREDADMKDSCVQTEDEKHILPLRLLMSGEEYIINDVLGLTSGHLDIDHIKVPHISGYGEVTMLHAPNMSNSFIGQKSNSMTSTRSIGSKSHLNKDPTKKKVGFAPDPPAYHANEARSMKKAPVHLDSTDGLIVVSVFLPVHVHRSPEGQWSADWDYEALLSMQSHLRVTRVGVVKWRGWHGNFGRGDSPEGGVPVEERSKVEECLRAFNCVPVWIEPVLFGEM